MKNIQLVLIIAILILIYLISMQWLGRDITPPESTPPVRKITQASPAPILVEKPVVIEKKTIPEITPAPTQKETIVKVEEEKKEEKILLEKKNPKLIEYKNVHLGYHFSLSDQMYYAGFGPKNGALHTIAIQPDTLPENFNDAAIRVFYFGKKILPELQNTQRFVDPNGKYILLRIKDNYSVRIESNNLNTPTVKAIEATINIDENI